MARIKSLLAIFLALTLLISPTTNLLADGPTQYQGGSGNTSDGHPWDDEVVNSDPGAGSNPNTPGQSAPVAGDSPIVNQVTAAASGSGAQFVAYLIHSAFGKWLRVGEMKVAKSKTVRRIR